MNQNGYAYNDKPDERVQKILEIRIDDRHTVLQSASKCPYW